MNENENAWELPEVVLTPEQEAAHWEISLRERTFTSLTPAELALMHHLPPLAQEMHDALADVLYDGDMPENILNLRRLAQWLENWTQTHVFTCLDGCKR